MATVVTLSPGDRVLVFLDRPDVTAWDAETIRERLSERFPETDFTVMVGVSTVLVDPAEDDEPDVPAALDENPGSGPAAGTPYQEPTS